MTPYKRLVVTIASVGSIAFAGLLAAPRQVLAQNNNGNPSIMTAVAAVQNTVNTILSRMNALTAANAVNFRATPTVLWGGPLGSTGVLCEVNNVSDAEHMVRMQFIDSLGATLAEFTQLYPPGTGSSIGGATGFGWYYCKFTVLDGTRNDIRGSIAIHSAAPPVFDDRFALAAE